MEMPVGENAKLRRQASRARIGSGRLSCETSKQPLSLSPAKDTRSSLSVLCLAGWCNPQPHRIAGSYPETYPQTWRVLWRHFPR